MTPETPGQRVANPQAPLAGASDATQRDPWHVPCLKWLEAIGRNCILPRYHAGTCLHGRWARTDITPENPSSSSTRSAS